MTYQYHIVKIIGFRSISLTFIWVNNAAKQRDLQIKDKISFVPATSRIIILYTTNSEGIMQAQGALHFILRAAQTCSYMVVKSPMVCAIWRVLCIMFVMTMSIFSKLLTIDSPLFVTGKYEVSLVETDSYLGNELGTALLYDILYYIGPHHNDTRV